MPLRETRYGDFQKGDQTNCRQNKISETKIFAFRSLIHLWHLCLIAHSEIINSFRTKPEVPTFQHKLFLHSLYPHGRRFLKHFSIKSKLWNKSLSHLPSSVDEVGCWSEFQSAETMLIMVCCQKLKVLVTFCGYITVKCMVLLWFTSRCPPP